MDSMSNKRSLLKSCSSTLECVTNYEVCVDQFCVNIEESTGVQLWVFGAIFIGVMILIFTTIGCLCLHPDSRFSLRNAHPKDKRLKDQVFSTSRKSSLSGNLFIQAVLRYSFLNKMKTGFRSKVNSSSIGERDRPNHRCQMTSERRADEGDDESVTEVIELSEVISHL